MKTLAKQFVAALAEDSDIKTLNKLGEIGHLFLESEKHLYDFVFDHASKHGVVPTLDTIEKGTKDTLPEVKEPASFYLEHMRERHIDRGLREVIADANDHMKPGPNKSPSTALELISSAIHELHVLDHANQLYDFRDALKPVMGEYHAAYAGLDHGLDLGWESFDSLSGGLVGGDLISFVGRPSKGKTWKLCYCAEYAWRDGHRPMIVTLEMKAQALRKRLAALHTHVPGMGLKLGQLTHKKLAQLKKGLESAATAEQPFWILDGGLGLTIGKLRLMVQQAKPTVLFVDGAYMIANDDGRMNEWAKIQAACKGLKMLSLEFDIPVVASWQFKRGDKKKKGEPEDPKGLDDVYGSDAMAQYSSIVLGLFQDDTVETIQRRVVQVLKGREGERGEFTVNWDFMQMDFSEVTPDTLKAEEEALKEQELPYV